MATKVIEAQAILSASDRTGKVLDMISKKLGGVAKSAKALESVKPLGNLGWGPKFQRDIEALQLSGKEMARLQKSWTTFNTLMRQNGVVGFSHYLRGVEQWKEKTLSNLREVRHGIDETQKHHQRFFGGAGPMLLGSGYLAGGYYAGRAIGAGVRASADRARELARYSLGGLSEGEKAQAATKADEISAKYPSISRTEVLGHIRQLRSRLGDFHHAMDNVETLTKAQVVLGTLGHGENASEDLEKLVLGLESQGIGSQPEKFKTYLNAFVRAKSLFPDLRGEDFRQYMQRANASKYGLSEEYLTSVVPTMMQHEGASNFGVMQASAFAALVGRRQSKAAKAAMRQFGLVDGNDRLLNESGFIKSPFKWAEANIVPALQKHGIATDEEHRGELVKTMTEMFSNRKVGEFFASMLVNRAIIDKDSAMLPQAKGTEAAAQVRSEDPYVALAGLTTQAQDLATAFIGMKSVITAMNDVGDEIAKRTKALKDGDYLKLLPEDDQRIVHGVARWWNTPAEVTNERNRRENLKAQAGEIDNKLAHWPLDNATKRRLRLRRFDLQAGIDASNAYENRPPLFTDAEVEQWQEMDREHRRGVALSSMPEPKSGSSRQRIPLPMQDPRGRLPQMPPVQPLDAAPTRVDVTGTVEGQLIGKIVIEDGTGLLKIRNELDRVIKLVGSMFNGGNGPGSAGHSSPDASSASAGIAYGP